MASAGECTSFVYNYVTTIFTIPLSTRTFQSTKRHFNQLAILNSTLEHCWFIKNLFQHSLLSKMNYQGIVLTLLYSGSHGAENMMTAVAEIRMGLGIIRPTHRHAYRERHADISAMLS